MIRRFFRQPLDDVLACLERLAEGRSPRRAMVVMVVSLVVTWFVYVPIHELLHAAGCVLAGGSISRLEIAAQYGGTLLAEVFPFVVAESAYAGRLSGFDAGGSDLIYLVTDFMPFVLSIVIGVPLIKWCGRRHRPVVFGMAVVVGLAPFYNVFGDYYEMGSIIVTRAVTLAGADPEATALPEPEQRDIQGYSAAYRGIRSDDVFKLAGELVSRPADLGFRSGGVIMVAFALMTLAFVLGVLLASVTYLVGHALVRGVGSGG